MKPIPFLRIIIPFLLGLYCSFYFDLKYNYWPLILLELLCILIFAMLQKHNLSKGFTMLLFDLLMFNGASILVQQSNNRYHSNSICNYIKDKEDVVYLASLSEIPIERNLFYKCELKISSIITNNKVKSVNGKVIAYFKKPIIKQILKPGKMLKIKSQFLSVPSPKNPMEFDYAGYLSNKQIYYSTFINEGFYCVYDSSRSNQNILFEWGLKTKWTIIERLRSSALSKDAFAICSALITGYDDEIDRSIIDAFAHSGTLHVLSVSGLHTGLIYLALNFLFNLFDPHNQFKRLRFWLISLLLWCFAFITGFSPPVLRAVLMFNFLGAGKIFYRSLPGNQLNILLFTAFILLSYNPFFIYDIGFLLSYSAMIGIIVLTPMMLSFFEIKNKIILYVYESMAVSVAATITTLPLTLFYFKQFPIWFFVCNLVVVPLTFLILILAFLSLFKLPALAYLVNFLVKTMITFIDFFNRGAFTYVDFIHFRLRDLLFLIILMFLLFYLFKERKFHYALFTLIILLFWQISCLMDVYEAKQSKFLTVYQVKNKSRIAIKNQNVVTYNRFDTLSFNYNLKGHFTSFNYVKRQVLPFNLVQTKGQSILVLDSLDFIPQTNLSNISTVLIANNFKLNADLVHQLSSLTTIIADGSNNHHIIYHTENLCRKFGIPFYSTRLRGALIMALE